MNFTLNNTAIKFRDEPHEKQIIQFYEDNGFRLKSNTKWFLDDCIGINDGDLGYWSTRHKKYIIITLPPEYEPKQIDYDQMALSFAKEMQLTTIEPTLELWENFKENYDK